MYVLISKYMDRKKTHIVMHFHKKKGVKNMCDNALFYRIDSYEADAFYYKTATLLASPPSDPISEPCGCLNLGLMKLSRHHCAAAAANSGSNGENGSQICDHIIGYRI